MGVKTKSLKLNFVMNALLTMSSFIFPLITFPYVSRVLGPDGTGVVAFATSVLTYFTMFAQLGIPTYGIRACSRVRDNPIELTRTVQEILIINTVTAVIAYAVFFTALFTVPRLAEEKPLFLVVSVTVFFNTIGMEWLYKALEQYTYITVRSVIFKFIGLGAMFLLVRSESDYVFYGAVTVLASAGSNLFNFLHCHRYVSLRPVGGYRFKRHLRAILVFFGMSCATTVYTHLDVAMLGFMTTDADVGYYNAAVKIKTILVSIVTSLGTVLLPRASYYAQNGKKDELYRITRRAMNFVILLATPLSLYFLLFVKNGIFFLSGDQYAGAVLPMQIIMPTLLLIGMTNILGMQILVPIGREKTVLLSEIVGAAVDLILNLLLIPPLKSAGAALGTLVAEIAVLIVQAIALRHDLPAVYREVKGGRALLALAGGLVAGGWVLFMHWGDFVSLAVSAVLFFGTYGGILLLTKEPLVTGLVGEMLGKFKLKKENTHESDR